MPTMFDITQGSISRRKFSQFQAAMYPLPRTSASWCGRRTDFPWIWSDRCRSKCVHRLMRSPPNSQRLSPVNVRRFLERKTIFSFSFRWATPSMIPCFANVKHSSLSTIYAAFDLKMTIIHLGGFHWLNMAMYHLVRPARPSQPSVYKSLYVQLSLTAESCDGHFGPRSLRPRRRISHKKREKQRGPSLFFCQGITE